MTLNLLNPQAPVFVPSVKYLQPPCSKGFGSCTEGHNTDLVTKLTENTGPTARCASRRTSRRRWSGHHRKENSEAFMTGDVPLMRGDVNDVNPALKYLTAADNHIRKTSSQTSSYLRRNVRSAATDDQFCNEEKKDCNTVSSQEKASINNSKSRVRDRKNMSRKESLAEVKNCEHPQDQKYSSDRSQRKFTKKNYDSRGKLFTSGTLQTGLIDQHKKGFIINISQVGSARNARNNKIELCPEVSSDVVFDEIEELIDHFPQLSGIRLPQRKLVESEILPTTKSSSSSAVSISYLDFARKYLDDRSNLKEIEDSQSLVNVNDSSWYFSSKENKTNYSCERTSNTSVTNDKRSKLSDTHLESDCGRSVKKEDALMGSGETDFKATSNMSTCEASASRSKKADECTSLTRPCSKSAADRWKGRWLQIARQQAVLEKARQLLTIDSAIPNSPVPPKDWHHVLSQGLEQSVPYSHQYSNLPVGRVGKERDLKSTAAAPIELSADESHAQTAPSLFFRWWSAVLAGDHTSILDMLDREKVNFDACFSYSAYLADCRLTTDSDFDRSSPLYELAVAHLDLDGLTHPHCRIKDRSRNGHLYSEQDQGFSAIHMCAKLSHPVLLDHMLRATTACGADYRDRASKLTALHVACEVCDLECAKILLLHGADPECRDKQGDTALHKSLLSTSTPISQLALVTFLCERSKSNCSSNGGSLKLNTKNRKKETALMFARTRDLAVVLIGAGADPLCVNYEGLDAASLAARRGDAKVLEAILGCNSFRQAPASLLHGSKGAENAQSSPHTTALHEAARVGSLSCVRVILAYCSSKDLNRLDTPGQFTPLMAACAGGHSKVVYELLNAGADPDVEDRRGVTGIVLAAGRGHLACVLAVAAARPHTLMSANSLGENILEMLARILAQDLLVLHPTHALSAAPSSSTLMSDVGLLRNEVIERSLPCIVELVMRGAVVTERFVRRLSSSSTAELHKLLKISRHEFTRSPRSTGERIQKASQMTFELNTPVSMWRVLPPSSTFYDVSFYLENGQQCCGHSFIVSADSAVLKAMLSSGMTVRALDVETGNAVMTISLPHHSKDSFSILIKWMYEKINVTETFKLTYLDDQEAIIALLYLSNELLVTPLQRLCEHAIGKHIDCFDKDSVLSLCLSLDLQILLTYFDSHYPIVDLLCEADLDFSLRTDLETFWDTASGAPSMRTKGIVGHQKESKAQSAGAMDVGEDQCWARVLHPQGRSDVMGDKSINDFIRSATDFEWCRWLSATPSSYVAGSVLSCSQDYLPSSLESVSVDCESNQDFGEDSLFAYWFLSAVQSAVSSAANSDREHVKIVLQVARTYFFERCCGLSSCDAEKRESSARGAAEKSSCFDYTCSSKSSHPPPPLMDSRQLSLRDMSIDERVKTMLGEHKTGTVSVNLLAESRYTHLNEDESFCEGHTAESPSIADTLDACRRDALGSSTCAAFDSYPSPLLSTVADDVLLSRHQEITPPCMLLHYQRTALLRDPDNSQFDVILVIVSPSHCSVDIQELGYSRGTGDVPQHWDTRNNMRHIPPNTEIAREGEEIVLTIPAHRAILSAASGKLSAMIHFAALQEEQSHFDATSRRHVSILEIKLEHSSEEVCSDLRDLIWFAYTGVLRDQGAQTHGTEGGDIDSATGTKWQHRRALERVDAEIRSARLLRLLWLSDEYLMPNLTCVLEHLMMRDLAPLNAAPFFMGAQALGLRALRVAAGLCVLYSMDAAKVCSKKKESAASLPSHCEYALGSPPQGGSVTHEADPHNDDYENSTALVLLEIFRTVSNPEPK